MGLDVYLYKCPNRAVADEAERKHEEFSELAWSKHERYEDFSEEEKADARKMVDEFNATIGIVDYQHVSRTKIELPSEKYPDHYFKIGYFRSSYNDSGINSVMRRIGLSDLYDLFETDGQNTDGVHDWEACRVRVVDAIEKYKAHLASPIGRFDVMDIDGFEYGKIKNQSEALSAFSLQFDRWAAESETRDRDAYSNRGGTFFPDGIKIYGVLPGVSKYGGRPVYIAYETEGREWYIQALEIVLETIDYILAQPDKEQYYLSWSG